MAVVVGDVAPAQVNYIIDATEPFELELALICIVEASIVLGTSHNERTQPQAKEGGTC